MMFIFYMFGTECLFRKHTTIVPPIGATVKHAKKMYKVLDVEYTDDGINIILKFVA